MNLIVICIDSLRKDHLGCFSNPWIMTPNFDRFYENSIVFENFKMNGIPTIPFRRGMMLGRKIFPFKDTVHIPGVSKILGWQPLSHDEVTFQEILNKAGYVTGMITDVWHYFWPAYNFHRGFDSWQFIRGHEADPYMTGESFIDPDQFVNQDLEGTKVKAFLEQYIRNFGNRSSEEDYFSPRVFRTAERWLEKNARYYENFYLYIDCFDPHEPWDPPREYRELYDPGYRGKEIIFPMNGYNEYLTQEEIRHIRALYAGKVTMVDRWFGHFMEKFHIMGLDKDTAVLLLSDHGVGLGEHGIFKKTPAVLYPELLEVPMMLMMPKGSREKRPVKGFVQEYDIAPTLLKLLGIEIPESMNGIDLWPLIKGEVTSQREYVVGGFHTHAYLRDQRYHYFRSLKEGEEEPQLFDLEKDPGMERNIAKKDTQLVRIMEERLLEELDGWRLPEMIGKSVAQLPYEPLGKRRSQT
ncbi:MAG: sulfatase [Deltaproteobacteria bacterium]|nr:sulfatase [Deltaproteobacteria bacterium]MBW2136811.1 sulfatase [Deltaproteobacteria bacterium]